MTINCRNCNRQTITCPVELQVLVHTADAPISICLCTPQYEYHSCGAVCSAGAKSNEFFAGHPVEAGCCPVQDPDRLQALCEKIHSVSYRYLCRGAGRSTGWICWHRCAWRHTRHAWSSWFHSCNVLSCFNVCFHA